MLRIFFVFLLFLAGCKKSTPCDTNQTARINICTDPQTLDPRKARGLTEVTLIRMLFEGLTRVSKTGNLEMALADRVEISEDGLRYTFHLRKSDWSNGDPVTSFDFAESWKSILNPHFATDMASQLYVIKNGQKARKGEIGCDQLGIYTPDARTVIVELEQPIPYFLELVSMTSFFPIPHKVAAINPNWALSFDNYVCNGPFVPKLWQHGDLIQIMKNTRYWQSSDVHLDAIDLLMISGDTEMRMFEEGKLDWVGSPLSTIPVDAVRSLKDRSELRVSPFSATYFYRTNTSESFRDKKNPLGNAQFRKALAFSLDRQGITEHILQGGHLPAKSLVPPEMSLSDKGYFQDGPQASARSLLTDALLALDLTLETLEPITISYCNSERNASLAQAVQKQWENELGIRVALEAIESKVFFQKISQKDYQIAAGSWTADFNDPINFLEAFKYKDTGTNNTNWENVKYIDLLNQSALCKDFEERKGLLREAEQILMDQMPIIPVFHFVLNYRQAEGLEEVALSPLGQIDFRWARMSSEPSLIKR